MLKRLTMIEIAAWMSRFDHWFNLLPSLFANVFEFFQFYDQATISWLSLPPTFSSRKTPLMEALHLTSCLGSNRWYVLLFDVLAGRAADWIKNELVQVAIPHHSTVLPLHRGRCFISDEGLLYTNKGTSVGVFWWSVDGAQCLMHA
jgi:hypothetical protein